jgi:hypothetical protein
MALILFDSNIFIDMLGGCHQACDYDSNTGVVSNVRQPYSGPTAPKFTRLK